MTTTIKNIIGLSTVGVATSVTALGLHSAFQKVGEMAASAYQKAVTSHAVPVVGFNGAGFPVVIEPTGLALAGKLACKAMRATGQVSGLAVAGVAALVVGGKVYSYIFGLDLIKSCKASSSSSSSSSSNSLNSCVNNSNQKTASEQQQQQQHQQQQGSIVIATANLATDNVANAVAGLGNPNPEDENGEKSATVFRPGFVVSNDNGAVGIAFTQGIGISASLPQDTIDSEIHDPSVELVD